ncbi:unnamed protein product, partial [Ectocarpus sp. 12 AP-2014]
AQHHFDQRWPPAAYINAPQNTYFSRRRNRRVPISPTAAHSAAATNVESHKLCPSVRVKDTNLRHTLVGCAPVRRSKDTNTKPSRPLTNYAQRRYYHYY